MDKNIINKLLRIAGILLLLAATLFICLHFFGEERNNTYLSIALLCLILSNLFNIIKNKNSK